MDAMQRGEKKASSAFFWNMIGGGLFAGQSALIMMMVARIYGQEQAGVVSIAYAVAVLTYTIARYGVRNYQVSDFSECFSFRQYLKARYISVFLSILVFLIYICCSFLFSGYSWYKACIIAEVTLLRMVNAVEDVFTGRYQQVGNFYVGARIMAIREMVILLVMMALLFFKIGLPVVLFVGILVSISLSFFMIKSRKEFLSLDSKKKEIETRSTFGLLKECFPLCIGTSLAIYMSNIPKYVTDWYLDELSQAIVGYLILPVFLVALLAQFIYTPFIKSLADLWNQKDIQGFKRKIVRQSLIIAALTFLVLGGTVFIGIPLLSFIYAIDLNSYSLEFIVLLCGGGLYALEYYLTIPVTIMHEQRKMVYAYVIAIAISLLLQKIMVHNYKILGVAALYVIVNLIIALILFIIIVLKCGKKKVE